MKKILICAYDLNIGGIEKSLINLLKEISPKYNIILLLQHKRGVFLNDIPKNVEIIDYNLSQHKKPIIRKIINRFKLLTFIIKNKSKYDTSICYTTYDYVSSIITRHTAKHKIIWIHTNYLKLFKNDKQKFRDFFNKRKIKEFDKLILVSNEAKNDFDNIYSYLNKKTMVINNLIDGKEIIEKSKDKIKEKYNNTITFVGRLEEDSKGLLLLFDVAKELKDFIFLIIGDGPDKLKYTNYIRNNKITNIKLLGKQNNPYPYVKQSDLIILPSKYEGFPVVALESLVLNKKFLTTINVSSNNFILSNYTYLTKRDKKIMKEDIIKTLNTSYKEKFDYNKFNKENLKLINEQLEDEK